MFSTFPDGLAGMGLLLLRVTAGGVLIVRCISYFSTHHDSRLYIVTLGLLIFTSGAFLVIGYRARIAAAIAAVVSIGIMFTWLKNYALVDSDLTAALVIVIAVAISCLGPGAFSLDSRLFGRREIIISRDP